MTKEPGPVAFDGGISTQPFVALLGTSLQFSDRMLRVLGFEFPEVRFERFGDPRHVLDLVPRPTLVILHESVPDLAALVESVRRALSGTMVAVACSDVAVVQRAFGSRRLPPISLLQVNTPIDVWLSVLRLLLCGHPYIPANFLQDWRGDADEVPPRRALQDLPDETYDAQLTPREMQILPLIARGMQNKTIAGELGLSEHTVKLHTHNIFSKLKVSNRTGAANWYLSQVEARSSGHDVHAK